MVKALQIPVNSPPNSNILLSSNFFGSKDASFAFISVNDQCRNVEMIVEITGHADGLVRKPIPSNEYAFPMPVRNSSNIRAVFAVYTAGKIITGEKILAIETIDTNGQFSRHDVPKGCIFLGVVNDQPLCVFAALPEPQTNGTIDYIHITAPTDSISDIYSGFDDRFIFAIAKNKVIMTALRGGTKRPFFYDMKSQEKNGCSRIIAKNAWVILSMLMS